MNKDKTPQTLKALPFLPLSMLSATAFHNIFDIPNNVILENVFVSGVRTIFNRPVSWVQRFSKQFLSSLGVTQMDSQACQTRTQCSILWFQEVSFPRCHSPHWAWRKALSHHCDSKQINRELKLLYPCQNSIKQKTLYVYLMFPVTW